MCPPAKSIEPEKVDQFLEITNSTRAVALEFLQIYDGNVQLAIDDFYVEKKLRSLLGKSLTLHHDETRKISFLTIIP